MVEISNSLRPSIYRNVVQQEGPATSILEFLSEYGRLCFQVLNKRMYYVLSAKIIYSVPIPKTTVILERKRTEFYISKITSTNSLQQEYSLLFKIGETDDVASKTYCPKTLGFSEVYFQYLIQVSDFEFYAFPLHDESYIKKGFYLKFDQSYKLISSKEIATLPEQSMRPTILKVKSKPTNYHSDLVFVGGHESRLSLKYYTKEDFWVWLPSLPAGHNISTSLAVNWCDQAVFTMIVDGRLNIKCAAFDLIRKHESDKK